MRIDSRSTIHSFSVTRVRIRHILTVSLVLLGASAVYVMYCWQEFWRPAQIAWYENGRAPTEVIALVNERLRDHLKPHRFDRSVAAWTLRHPGDAGPRTIWVAMLQDSSGRVSFDVMADARFSGATVELRNGSWTWQELPCTVNEH